MIVLCINSGSSSLKTAVIDIGNGEEKTLATVSVESIGQKEGHSLLTIGDGEKVEDDASCANPGAALDHALALLAKHELETVDVISHRIVHGGPQHFEPTLVDDALVASLHRATRLAPLHMPTSLATIEALGQRYHSVPQVVCFDTGFHNKMPDVAKRLPVPEHYAEAGVRKYGFHGISYEYVMSTLGENVPSRLVIAHLGSGASLVAVKDGTAIDTTMGMTPTGGIVMSSRTGDLDPGVLVYLEREHHLTADTLETLVDHEGGLMAIGGSKDMKRLVAARSGDLRADLAVRIFCYGVKKAVGSFAAALGGLDLLIFTGGIGEHANDVRAEICRGLEFLGAEIRVVATDEDVVLARHAAALMRVQGKPQPL